MKLKNYRNQGGKPWAICYAQNNTPVVYLRFRQHSLALKYIATLRGNLPKVDFWLTYLPSVRNRAA